MNFVKHPDPVGRETISMTMPALSDKAKEILAVMEEVRVHEQTESHVEVDDKGGKWLSMTNIVNGHEEATEEYIALMRKLGDALDDNLVTKDGQHSDLFYELKNAGYRLRTGESDTWGPLSAVIKCPNGEWSVSYG